jgi:tetratricopeptide (TPR) repeat protein
LQKFQQQRFQEREIEELRQARDPSAARQLVDLYLRLAEEKNFQEDKKGEGIAYMGAAKHQALLARQEKDLNEYKRAMFYYYKARGLFREINDTARLASAYSSAGGLQLEIAKRTGEERDFRKVLQFKHNGAKFSRVIGDLESEAICLDIASHAAWRLAQYPQSDMIEFCGKTIRYGQQAIRLFKSLQRDKEIPYIYSRMGRALLYIGESEQDKTQLENAIEHFKNAREGFRDLRNRYRRRSEDLYLEFRQEEAYALSFRAKAYRKLARIQLGTINWQKGIRFGKESSRIFLEEIHNKRQAANDLIGIAIAYLRLSEIAGEESDFKASVDFALEALQLFRETAGEARKEIAYALRWAVLARGKYALRTESLEGLLEALTDAREMIEVTREVGNEPRLAYAYFDAAKVCHAIADRTEDGEQREEMYKEAIANYSEALKLGNIRRTTCSQISDCLALAEESLKHGNKKD